MKNILVATDFSNNAYSALFYATQLLKSEACTFHILNIYNELTPLSGKSVPFLGRKKQLEALQKESQDRLTETSHKIVLDAGNPKHKFHIISVEGDLAKTVTKQLDKKEIDFLVMGNKGLTDTADIFFGSNTIKVVNTMAKCAILAIPKEMDYTAPQEIAFVTDYKTSCHPNTIAPLLFIAALTKAAVRVMHINDEQVLNKTQENNREHLVRCLEGVEHSFHTMYEFDDKAKVIETFLNTMQIDLYAMVNRKKNLFERMTREPIIKDVSMYSDVPFLVLPDKS